MTSHPRNRRGVSRRQVLRSGAAALGVEVAALLDQGRQAVQDTADRTIITGVIEFA